MDENTYPYDELQLPLFPPTMFTLDRARNALRELLDEVPLTDRERAVATHWLRFRDTDELEVLESLLTKFRALPF